MKSNSFYPINHNILCICINYVSLLIIIDKDHLWIFINNFILLTFIASHYESIFVRIYAISLIALPPLDQNHE